MTYFLTHLIQNWQKLDLFFSDQIDLMTSFFKKFANEISEEEDTSLDNKAKTYFLNVYFQPQNKRLKHKNDFKNNEKWKLVFLGAMTLHLQTY